MDLRAFFKENASEDYKFNIDLSIPFEEHNLKDITLNVLAMLNLNYWCETEEEKHEWEVIYNQNKKKYEEELQKKHNNLDNIFNKRKEQTFKKRIEDKELQEKRLQEEADMLEAARIEIVEYEETLLKKVINKIKTFFNKY